MKMSGYAPFDKVFVEYDPDITLEKDDKDCTYQVKILKFDSDEIILRVRSDKNGIIFIPEYYDDGWKAKVNGHPVDVIRANASFRGIPIEKGLHTIRMYYSPGIVYAGGAISVITVLIGMCLVIFQYVKRKRVHC
jgi:uncharacterized membrane protein YfhO